MKKGSKHSYERESRHPGGMHGSPHETAKFHGGHEAGAGELTIGMGPGKAALRTHASEVHGIEEKGKKHGKIRESNPHDESDD